MTNARTVLDPKALEAQLLTNSALRISPADILEADKVRLLAMQRRLGLGSEWGVIDCPKAFLPQGTKQHESQRVHNVSKFLPKFEPPSSPAANEVWSEVLRFAIARLTQPNLFNSNTASYSTCMGDLNVLKPIVRIIVGTSATKGRFWSRVGEDASTAKSEHSRIIFRIQRHYHKIGALPDAFRGCVTVTGDEPELDRSGTPEHEQSINENRQWQRLPMEFVSETGWRSLRLIKTIAPTLLDALETALREKNATCRAEDCPLSERSMEDRTRETMDRVIAGWQWVDETGMPLIDMGFDIYLKSTSSGKRISWPPRTFGQAWRLVHTLVKPAHLWMVLLGDGNRNSEAVSMRDDCLAQNLNGNFRWKGRTYKLTGITGGREIESVPPEIIGQSIIQQMRIAELSRNHRGLAGNALWVGETVDSINHLTNILNSYVEALGLRHLLGDKNTSCHEHRFRKTLAWIVAVALTNSIMILKDCFGHTDAAMTLLHYIASDPSIAQEVIKVQKELTIIMAVDVILDCETVGGPGASALRQRAEAYLKRIGKSKFEPQDAYEFARRETFDGRAWMTIAPGILCTAPHDVTQAATPCAMGQKRHNPANCKTDCEWQLLLKGVHVTQADDTVEYALKNLQKAVDMSDEAGISFWVGQAKSWLYRYDVVADKWKNHSLVVTYVQRPARSLAGDPI